mmetsp:Transcript_39587/g.95696  ORF Transcript_39587/g.95696 Transcript_39587/m.95696 type:complete len:462 (-) Transcript_39587:392-1777(-)
MPQVTFCGKNASVPINGFDGFAEEELSMRVESVSNDNSRFMHYDDLCQLMKAAPMSKKFHTISIEGIDEISPDFLAFLVAAFRKTLILHIGNAAYDAVSCGCIMAGLMMPDGIGSLRLLPPPNDYRISSHAANLLFNGLGSAASLQMLEIDLYFEEHAAIGAPLIKAIQSNCTLTDLTLYLEEFEDATVLPKILRAAVLDTKIERIHLECPWKFLTSDLEILSRQDCTLEDLTLCLLKPSAVAANTSVSGQSTTKNKSVKELTIREAEIRMPQIVEVIGLFTSLTHLSLEYCGISDLSPLDHLLLGDQVILQSLSFECNQVEERDAMEFLTKLPRMKSLVHLELGGNPFLRSESCLAALEDAVSMNTTLQSLPLPPFEKPEGRCEKSFLTTRVPLSLNRLGRQYLLDVPSKSFPENLWPLVLERAMKLKYFSFHDDFYSASMESTRVDVVYWLLREKMLVL